MKFLKSWNKYFENADSPELVGKFSPEEIKKLALSDDPYDWENPIRRFQYGLTTGGPSADLNNDLSDIKQKGYGSMYGVSEYLLHELRKAIPDFKDYKFNEYDDMYSDFYDGKLGLHLKKSLKLEGTRFDAESEIWIYYHTKSNRWLDYKKGKFYILYTCGLRPTEKSFDLMGGIKKETSPEDENVKKAFTDMIKTKPCSNCSGEEEIELDDKGFDKFCYSLSDILYGHPDKEDENLHDKLTISYKNLTIESFLKTLPKVKTNLDYFKKYLLNKYNLKF